MRQDRFTFSVPLTHRPYGDMTIGNSGRNYTEITGNKGESHVQYKVIQHLEFPFFTSYWPLVHGWKCSEQKLFPERRDV